MIVKALTGSKRYWGWVTILLFLIAIGFTCYLWQLNKGLSITGMSRDVSWGLYISQFTFLVGVAASAVMVVLPYYLHNVKAFGRITILGEFLAVAALIMCLLFVLVDVGKPMRILNMIFYPTPSSMFFWDMIALSGYLLLNIIAGWHALEAEYKAVPPPAWTKILVYISIPWAVSIHTVTAFLYAGLPGRHYWLTAIMAARFLASAFASGPALLILLCYIIKRVSKFDPGREALQKLAAIVTYATIVSAFFIGLEFFTAFYSQAPAHGMYTLKYLFAGLDGHGRLVIWMWAFAILVVLALVLLINPKTRTRDRYLQVACTAVFISMWIEKGIGLVIGGFVPNPFERVTEYAPTLPETLITIGVWAIGALVLTFLYKIAVSIKEEIV
ncbi:sulfate reduction electron transfer complex DsrMKJOP subunit DsrP [Moorella sulfitireducens (nom. illeg.)]|uniref:sulfate reduction electron transfer complex DsrMKJOP subunit DsrP n=1 Tax=Neomoorella sulfitireducens TaxID=2972948 RepID=UPI0021ACDB40|nr:NrfD/PsrC family molybdoenzyme membrane anchor subunit [Moorella sulfitireducens]